MKRRPARATSKTALPKRSALLLTAALAAGTLAISGCQRFSPITTDLHYDPADGVSATLGDVAVHDLLVVAGSKGAAGVVSGYVVNSGDQEVTLQLKAPNAEATQTKLPPHSTVKLSGGDTGSVQVSTVAVAPGSMLDLQLKTPDFGAQEVPVPVLLPDGYYATVTPTSGSGG